MFDTHKYIQVIPVGMLETNCVLIQNPVSNILYVIDPGGDAPKILRKIQEFQNISAYRIVLTHAHFDHISAAGQEGAEAGFWIQSDPNAVRHHFFRW